MKIINMAPATMMISDSIREELRADGVRIKLKY